MEQSPTFFDPTLFLLFGFMILIYFLMIRPENKRRKTHQEMISSLEMGDEIVTAGGILGKVSKITDQYISPTVIEINALSDIDEEQFGPILHVLKFKSSEIDDLIKDINNTGYGLTMGIHTRIESRADLFSQNCNIGNVYINRDIVGAVVGSQPFGGRGLSGSGYKAGGPNYLIQFLNEKVVSKNSVAFGGNAELLNIQED